MFNFHGKKLSYKFWKKSLFDLSYSLNDSSWIWKQLYLENLSLEYDIACSVFSFFPPNIKSPAWNRASKKIHISTVIVIHSTLIHQSLSECCSVSWIGNFHIVLPMWNRWRVKNTLTHTHTVPVSATAKCFVCTRCMHVWIKVIVQLTKSVHYDHWSQWVNLSVAIIHTLCVTWLWWMREHEKYDHLFENLSKIHRNSKRTTCLPFQWKLLAISMKILQNINKIYMCTVRWLTSKTRR